MKADSVTSRRQPPPEPFDATVLACLLLLPSLASAQAMRLPPETVRLNQMSARFAPVDIRVDLSGLPEPERRALASLIKAARITDALFMRQMWAGNEAMLLRLMEDETRSAARGSIISW